MNRPISDEEVARLDLREGRDHLLEEIMSIPVGREASSDTELPDTAPAAEQQPLEPGTLAGATAITSAPTARRRRWVPAVAAAAVLAVAGVTGFVVLGGDGDGPGRGTDSAPPVAGAPAATGSGLAALRADGWTAAYVSTDTDDGELRYENGDAELEIRWKAAAEHAEFVEDRNDIGPAAAVTVLDLPGKLWNYSADDHTVIRDPEAGFFLEFRGQGMDEAAYRALLEKLVPIGPDDVEAQLPEQFITADERPAEIERMLSDIPLPPGYDPASITSTEADPYQLGADVTGAVTCAWIDDFAAAKAKGDAAAVAKAQAAMGTSRQWAVLQEMKAGGDWPAFIWEYADQMKAGTVPDRDGLCS